MAGERYDDVNIPLDLTVEIVKKLPAKSIMRFLCVSKQWRNTIRDFIVLDSIVTRSLTEPSRDPHFIFQKRSSSGQVVFSYAYQNEKKRYHEKVLHTSNFRHMKQCQYVRGLIGFWSLPYGPFRIHNPTTSQSISLPYVSISDVWSFLFGYDPLANQYKVVCFIGNYPKSFHQVFTLGDSRKQWRNIQCSIGAHCPLIQSAVCINGTIYYKATKSGTCILASFDVRSEKFDHLQAPAHFRENSPLVNYQGKLGCIPWNERNKGVDLWVMEDAKKQEWSKITSLSMLQGLPSSIKFLGVTNPGGEIYIVLGKYSDDQIPLEVHYYDLKRNSPRIVEIKTTVPTDLVQIWTVTDHVENTMWL